MKSFVWQTFFPSATVEGLDCQLVPPRAPFFKLNVDGAVFAGQKAAGLDAVIYDENGHLIAALSKKIDAPLGALEAEAKALESGLHFTLEMGIYDLVIESDSLILYNALRVLVINLPLPLWWHMLFMV